LSHAGKVRANNEDAYLFVKAERSLHALTTNLPPGSIPEVETEVCYGLLVADGVGGMAAGEVASRLAVTTLTHLVLDTPDWILLAVEPESARILKRMAERFTQVDSVLRAAAKTDSRLAGMGTTMTVAAVLGRELFVSHVGDSRVYLSRGAEFRRLTRDHTGAEELAAAGWISTADVASHPFRGALTRALGGTTNSPDAEVGQFSLFGGDQLLLCTDGLTDMVDDEAIAATIRASATSHDACQALVDLALEKGGRDNVTVMIARCQFPPEL
jgi:protein phosphatase